MSRKSKLATAPSRLALCIAFAAVVGATAPAQAEKVAVDAAILEQLQQIIKQQQDQLKKQSQQLQSQGKTLQSLQTQVEGLQKTTSETQTIATEAQSKASAAKSTAEEVKHEVASIQPANDGRVVTSGEDKVKLAISGQVNRAINIANDGTSTKYYNVDNNTSNSRVRFVGTGKVSDDVTLGTQIELAIGPNQSSDVSQDNENSGDFFDQRKVEVWADSKTYGRLTLGKGSSATDNVADGNDLAGTDVVQYASIADTAGGLKFRDKDTDDLTDIQIKNAFNDFDGNRQNRVMYTTPKFNGFYMKGSAGADQNYDGSLWYAGEGYGFKVVSAVGARRPNNSNNPMNAMGSVSALHKDTGLNLTLSSGRAFMDGQGDQQNYYVKAGWLADFFDFGKTAMAVDYTRGVNIDSYAFDNNSVGGAVVQKIPEWGTEIYAQYRWYQLGGANVEDISVGTVGTRVKF